MSLSLVGNATRPDDTDPRIINDRGSHSYGADASIAARCGGSAQHPEQFEAAVGAPRGVTPSLRPQAM